MNSLVFELQGRCNVSSKALHAIVTAIVVGVLLVSTGTGHAGLRENAPVRAGDRPNLGIENFGRVNDTYYRGAEPADDQYAALAALGIKTVVDLRSDDLDAEDQRLVERAGMKYEHIPMTTHQAPTSVMVDGFLKIVTEPVNQPVYVHCVGGRHRTGVMTAVYRMNHHRWTADEAFKEMKQYKFGPDFLHPEFKKFVYAYQADPHLAAKAGD